MKLRLLNESPHTRIIGGFELPLIRRGDRVDWGFEDMGLPVSTVNALERSLREGDGVVLTGTRLVLKAPSLENADGLMVSRYPETVIIPADRHGSPLELPENWIRSIYVVDSNYNYTWIGDKVRPDRIGGTMATNKMRKVDGGWISKDKIISQQET